MRHSGRHRVSGDGQHGRHRDPSDDRVHEGPGGRHRPVAVQPVAIGPLLAVSGSVAAAALTAIVLSGPQGPLAALLGERDEEPRPSATSADPRGGAPTAAGIDLMSRGFATESGRMSSTRGLSVWDVLSQQHPGEPGSVLAMLCDGPPGGGSCPPGAGTAGAEGGPLVAGAGVQPAPLGTPPSAAPTTSTSSALGTGDPVQPGTGQQAPAAGSGPGAPPQPSGTSGTGPGDDGGAAGQVLGPGTTVADPGTTVAEPGTTVADPGTTAAEALEPVANALESVEPIESEVPEAPEPPEAATEPVTDAIEPVDPAVPDVSEAEVEESIGRAGVPSGGKLPSAELPD